MSRIRQSNYYSIKKEILKEINESKPLFMNSKVNDTNSQKELSYNNDQLNQNNENMKNQNTLVRIPLNDITNYDQKTDQNNIKEDYQQISTDPKSTNFNFNQKIKVIDEEISILKDFLLNVPKDLSEYNALETKMKHLQYKRESFDSKNNFNSDISDIQTKNIFKRNLDQSPNSDLINQNSFKNPTFRNLYFLQFSCTHIIIVVIIHITYCKNFC